MDIELLRLECLRLATGIVSMSESSKDRSADVLDTAEKLLRFVKGRVNAGTAD